MRGAAATDTAAATAAEAAAAWHVGERGENLDRLIAIAVETAQLMSMGGLGGVGRGGVALGAGAILRDPWFSLEQIQKAGANSPMRLIRALGVDDAQLKLAEAGGFLTHRPMFHGSNREFYQFDPARLGAGFPELASARRGFWAAMHPSWAANIAKTHARNAGGDPRIYPLFARTANPVKLLLPRGVSDDAISEALLEQFSKGADYAYLASHLHHITTKLDAVVIAGLIVVTAGGRSFEATGSATISPRGECGP